MILRALFKSGPPKSGPLTDFFKLSFPLWLRFLPSYKYDNECHYYDDTYYEGNNDDALGAAYEVLNGK